MLEAFGIEFTDGEAPRVRLKKEAELSRLKEPHLAFKRTKRVGSSLRAHEGALRTRRLPNLSYILPSSCSTAP